MPHTDGEDRADDLSTFGELPGPARRVHRSGQLSWRRSQGGEGLAGSGEAGWQACGQARVRLGELIKLGLGRVAGRGMPPTIYLTLL